MASPSLLCGLHRALGLTQAAQQQRASLILQVVIELAACTLAAEFSDLAHWLKCEPVPLTALKLAQAIWQPPAKPLHIVTHIAIGHHTTKTCSILLSCLLPWFLWYRFGQAVTDPSHHNLVQENIRTGARLLMGVFTPKEAQCCSAHRQTLD